VILVIFAVMLLITNVIVAPCLYANTDARAVVGNTLVTANICADVVYIYPSSNVIENVVLAPHTTDAGVWVARDQPVPLAATFATVRTVYSVMTTRP